MAQYREKMGSLIDFPNQLSPYYNEDHRAYRLIVRKCNEELFSKYKILGKKKSEKEVALPHSFFKKLATQYPECYFFPFGYGKWTNNGHNVPFDPFYTISSVSLECPK